MALTHLTAEHTSFSQIDILDLRHFGSAQLRPLLERETKLWAERMAWDYKTSVEMILRYIDARILPGYAAVDGGAVVGYSFFVYEGSKGVIGDLYVDPDSERRGERESLQERLVLHVIETLQQSPGIHRIESQLLVHDSGDAAVPFVRTGFRRHPRVFMYMPLERHVAPAKPLLAEIELRRWSEQDFQPAASVITAAYRGHVDAEINDQYRTTAGSLRFLNNIIRFPGCGAFDSGSSLVAVHRSTGLMIGLLLCSRVRDDVGHITQVCVVPEYRGKSIGENLIAQCARGLGARGFSALSLTVTQANARAVMLYERLGFDRTRLFDAFVWEG
jgi:ribosomal protein S18 acetylase RimI-like enzyme